MQNDPESDFEDCTEFFRRGDDGDYVDAESLPAGSIAFENDQSVQADPKVLERQLERRARYTRRVKLGMSALSLATVVAFFAHALQPSAGDSRSAGEGHVLISDASSPRHAAQAPAKRLEVPSLVSAPPAPNPRAQSPDPPQINPSALGSEIAITAPAAKSSQPSTATVAGTPRATKVATTGARGAGRQALASNLITKPLSRSSLPSLAPIQAPINAAASHPPTARFAD